MEFSTFYEVERFLYKQIPDSKLSKYKGGVGLDEVKKLLRLLGSPQEKYKVVHVAGTSGKGSVCRFVADLLKGQGFRVGLTSSPHAWTLRERVQILDEKQVGKADKRYHNNPKLVNYSKAFLSEEKFVKYFNQIHPFLNKVESLSFFELFTVLFLYSAWKEGVEYVVLEVGLGGLLDASNVIKNPNKICVINKIGLDHTEILGEDIKKIAKQKVGIIGQKNVCFTIEQGSEIMEVIKQEVVEKEAQLFVIKSGQNFDNVSWFDGKTQFDFKFEDLVLKGLKIGLSGRFQVENCSVALAILKYLSGRDEFNLKVEKIYKSLEEVFLPGRFEIYNLREKKMILDIGHNPQKIGSFCASLAEAFPNQKYNFVIGMKSNKNVVDSLRIVSKIAQNITLFEGKKVFTKDTFTAKDREFKKSTEMEKTLSDLAFSKYKSFDNLERSLKHSLGLEGVTILLGSAFSLEEAYDFIEKFGQ